MIFNKEEYKVSDDEITINKATLETWKTHYCDIMDKVDDEEKRMFYMGKFFRHC